MIDWTRPEQVIATLTDADVFHARLAELKLAVENAARQVEQVTKLQAKYETADRLRAEAAALLVKISEREVSIARREVAVRADEVKLLDRQQALAEREVDIARRERNVEQRAATLHEIATAGAAS